VIAAAAGPPIAVSATSEPLRVAVSIQPQREFVQRVAGGLVAVEVLVRPGHSPATYEPTPKQMVRMAEADFWIRIGVPFERSVLRNLAEVAPDLEVVDGRRGVELVHMENPTAGRNGHAGEPDPHFWLDPQRVKVHATTIRDALCELRPSRCEGFGANLSTFHGDLDAADRWVADTLAPVAGREIFVFHPAYGYFTRRYRLRQVPVETGGKEPTARQLADIIDRARASGTRALFVQPQFSGSSARAVADAIGVALVELDPLASDYIDNLHVMAARIVEASGG
jgi:zinc transport system substrate-binding protein